MNERTFTAWLEHEKVLSHNFLDFFSTARLGQKFATKGANSVHPSHMKKIPSVLMYTYIELNIVTVLSYFISVYSMNCAY
jgi:p-aminobenzoyl-glutamate transporter AbgT